MLFNKKYIYGMSISLTVLLAINITINRLILIRLQNGSLPFNQALDYSLILSIILICIALLIVGFFLINNLKNHKFLQKKAEKESETYLLNETAMLHKLAEIIELNHNYGIKHSLLLMTIKYKGDNKTLYEIVSSIEMIIRKNDTLFRMNDGKFAIVANCNLNDAMNLGQKLIKKMAALQNELEATIDINIGITHTGDHDTKNQMLDRALKSVDASQRYGKNRVEYMN